MTEAEWLACEDPTPMLEFLDGKASERKLRLFAVACCRRFWHLLDDNHGRPAVDAAERCADGTLSVDELWAIGKREDLGFSYDLHKTIAQRLGVDSEIVGSAFYAVGLTMGMMGWRQASTAVEAAASTAGAVGLGKKADEFSYDQQEEYEQAAMPFTSVEKMVQVILLREIVGNPFRPVAVNPSWLTSTVTALAEGIYADRAFDRLPILADALQDAGCDDEDVLNHCRRPGPHVKGSWVIDLLTGRR